MTLRVRVFGFRNRMSNLQYWGCACVCVSVFQRECVCECVCVLQRERECVSDVVGCVGALFLNK